MINVDSFKSRKELRCATLLIFGMISPYLYTTRKNLDQVVSQVGGLEILRGIGPFIFYFSALFLFQNVRRNAIELRSVILLDLYFFTCVASTVWSIYPKGTFLKSIQCLGVYLCARRLISLALHPEVLFDRLNRILRLIVLSALFLILLMPEKSLMAGDNIGAGVLVPSIASNLLGSLAGFTIVGSILIINESKLAKFFWISSSTIVLFATQARLSTAMTIVLTFVSLLFVSARNVGGYIQKTFIVIGTSSLFLLVFLLPLLQRISISYLNKYQGNSSNFQTFTGRTIAWRAAVDYIAESPFLGHGYYSGHRLGLALNFAELSRFSNIDNTWLESLVDVGIIGTLFLIIFFIRLFFLVQGSMFERNTKLYCMITLSGILMMSFFNPSVQSPTITQTIFLTLAGGILGKSGYLSAIEVKRSRKD